MCLVRKPYSSSSIKSSVQRGTFVNAERSVMISSEVWGMVEGLGFGKSSVIMLSSAVALLVSLSHD